MKKMKSILCSLFVCILMFSAQSFAQQEVTYGKNGTVQMPNLGFEDYLNEGENEIVPVGWSSFYSATGGAAGLAKGKRVAKISESRPGSAGSYCLNIFSTVIIGIKANGNLTTGRINANSATAKDATNYNYTDREDGYAMPFTGIPDSVVVWAKKVGYNNKAFTGKLSMYIHNDNYFQDGYACDIEMANAVTKADLRLNGNNGVWIRYSAPFDKTGCGSADPRYILATLTTNQTPGECKGVVIG